MAEPKSSARGDAAVNKQVLIGAGAGLAVVGIVLMLTASVVLGIVLVAVGALLPLYLINR